MTLTDEQREFRAVVRQFVEAKIAPLAGDIDRSAEYSWETFEALKSMELTALSYPEEYGGSGASLVVQAIVTEELARACVSTSLQFLISKLGMLPVINFGSDQPASLVGHRGHRPWPRHPHRGRKVGTRQPGDDPADVRARVGRSGRRRRGHPGECS